MSTPYSYWAIPNPRIRCHLCGRLGIAKRLRLWHSSTSGSHAGSDAAAPSFWHLAPDMDSEDETDVVWYGRIALACTLCSEQAFGPWGSEKGRGLFHVLRGLMPLEVCKNIGVHLQSGPHYVEQPSMTDFEHNAETYHMMLEDPLYKSMAARMISLLGIVFSPRTGSSLRAGGDERIGYGPETPPPYVDRGGGSQHFCCQHSVDRVTSQRAMSPDSSQVRGGADVNAAPPARCMTIDFFPLYDYRFLSACRSRREGAGGTSVPVPVPKLTLRWAD